MKTYLSLSPHVDDENKCNKQKHEDRKHRGGQKKSTLNDLDLDLTTTTDSNYKQTDVCVRDRIPTITHTSDDVYTETKPRNLQAG